MFVRCRIRRKDGKVHRYWSIVENVRVASGRVVQRQVLHLGEIGDNERAAWRRSIKVLEGKTGTRQLTLFPEDRAVPESESDVVQVKVRDLELHDPRQWGDAGWP